MTSLLSGPLCCSRRALSSCRNALHRTWARLFAVSVLLGLAGPLLANAAVAALPNGVVGTPSSPVSVNLTVAATGTAATLQSVIQGVPGLDLSVVPGGTCATGVLYTAGQQCTVSIVFTPLYPGVRQGAVQMKAADGTLLASTLVAGQATGSLAVLNPGIISTVAGDGELNYRTDNVPALDAPIFLPYGIVTDPTGNLYISDTNNSRIRRVDAASHIITTIAGNGIPGYSGDNGPATSASISQPGGITLDGAGNLYFADSGNSLIRRIDAVSGIITTVAGTPNTQGFSGDGALATAAQLSSPRSLAFDLAGNLFLSDTGNQVIRRVDASTGKITTVAGTPNVGAYNGDNIPATTAMLDVPWGIAVAPDGSLYIADLANSRVRKVTAGIITTVAGNGLRGYNGDGSAAISAQLNDPTAVALDPAGNLYIADSENNRVRVVSLAGTITSLVGNTGEQFTGDGGPANVAGLYAPYALFLDQTGGLFISDTLHNRIRSVPATPAALGYPVMRVSKTSDPQAQSLENHGNAALNLSAPVFVNSALDPATTTCLAATPIAIGAACNLGVEFAPTTIGDAVLGSLTIPSDSGNNPVVINLSGQVLSVEPTTTALTSSLNPSLLGQSITLTATVSSDDPTRSGPVTFLDGATTLCANVQLNGGVASCTAPALTLGQHTLTASYAGDSNNAASVSPALTQTVKQQAVAALTASPSPSIVTQTVTLTATVTAPTGTPTGAVTFMDAGVALGAPVPVNGSGVATITTATLAPGSHSLTVSYAGDTTNASAISPAVALTVQQAASTITLATTSATVVVGTAVTFTATVSDQISTVPTGSVQFTDGLTALGSAPLDNTGHASITLTTLAPGAHIIVGTYAGDTNDATSTSAPLPETIQQIATTTLVSSDTNPAGAGSMIHIKANVAITGNTPAAGLISGTVTFRDGSTIIGAAPVDSTGMAGISIATLTPGAHSIVATYPGNTNYAASTSVTLVQTITATTTTTTLSTGLASQLAGKSISFTATVASNTGTPTGNVLFQDGSLVLGQGVLNAQGVANFSTSALAVGSHAITAVYQGDGSYLTSTSTAVAESVSLATTALTLSSQLATVQVGATVTLTGALTSNGVTPTGSITLKDGSTALSVQTLSASGAFTFSLATLPLGPNTLTAVYTGDSDNAAATSAIVSVTVQQASSTTALATSGTPAVLGQPVSFTATVTSSAASLSGTVSFQDGATAIGSSPINPSGVATLTTSSLAFGPHTITAVYSGDTNHATSTSSGVSQQIVEPSTVALSSSANPAVSGISVTFTAKVAGTATLIPTGSIVFSDGPASVATVTLDATGTAVWQTSNLAVGQHPITATYSGDHNFQGSASSPVVEVIQSANTQVALTAASNPATYGAPLALTASVTSNGGIATGTITFTDGSATLGTAVLNSSGVAVLTTSSLAPGVHTILATYAGDGRASASVSSPLSLSVRQVSTVSLASSGNPSPTLSAIQFTAVVGNSGASVPTGSIVFTDGSTQLGTVALDSSGHAVLNVPQLTAGTHSLTASYAGDSGDFASASTTLSQVISLRPTTTALTSSATDPTNPQVQTLIGIVRWTGPVIPTGLIVFSSGNTILGTAAIDGSGAATLNITLSPGETQNVVANYGGDISYAPSSSSSVSVSGGQATQFGIALNPPTVTLVSRQHTNLTLTLSSIKGFTDTVQLGCVGLPIDATCTFSTIAPVLAANNTATVTLNLDTGDPLGAGALARSDFGPLPGRGSRTVAAMLPAGLLAACGLFAMRRRRPLRLLVVLLGAAVAVSAITGCAGLSMNGTPPGTYTFKITGSGQATGATVTQSFTLIVK